MGRWNATHRQWPLPRRPWVMAMRWDRLLFAHWPVDPALLAGSIPAGLSLDTFAGSAWLGIVPFEMRAVRGRCLPPVPGLSAFPELNVRTYVTVDGKPGVYFFSLDAAHRPAVEAARWSFHLPYFRAEMHCRQDGQGYLHYLSRRLDERGPRATFAAKYRPVGPAGPAETEQERFLVERYCLYAADAKGRIRRGDIHHASWQLQPAEAQIHACDMTELLGFNLPDIPPLLHYARPLHVRAWLPRKV